MVIPMIPDVAVVAGWLAMELVSQVVIISVWTDQRSNPAIGGYKQVMITGQLTNHGTSKRQLSVRLIKSSNPGYYPP